MPARRWSAASLRGPAGSLLLHLLVFAALVLLLPWLKLPPPETQQPIAVNLVRLGPKAAATAPTVEAPVPQQPADAPSPVPAAGAPPPSASPVQGSSNSSQVAAPAPAPKPSQPPTRPKAVARLPRPPVPRQSQDSLAARLQQLARLRQPAAPLPIPPGQEHGAGLSNAATRSAEAAMPGDAAYGVRDMIRAAVERRWNPDRGAIERDWTVSIRIRLAPDGTVTSAQIIGNARHGKDEAYKDFARSARNAVLLSSPLPLPGNTARIAQDVVVEFDANDMLR